MTQAPSPISGLAERLRASADRMDVTARQILAAVASGSDYGCGEAAGLLREAAAALASPLPVAAEDEAKLPCDVQIPGALFKRGVSLSTLLIAISRRADWDEADTSLERRPLAAHGEVTEEMVEDACAAYAKATGYYVEFHRGLRSESSDKMRRGMRAALEASITKTAAPLGVETQEEVLGLPDAAGNDEMALAALPIPAPDAQVVAVPTVVREAAEFTREDLGPNGTSYPHIRAMLSFIEGLIATPVTGEADVGGRLADSVDKAEAWDMLAAKSATIVELRSRVEALTAEVGTAKAEAFEEAAQIADGWEHTRAGQEIADAIRARAVKGAGQS